MSYSEVQTCKNIIPLVDQYTALYKLLSFLVVTNGSINLNMIC